MTRGRPLSDAGAVVLAASAAAGAAASRPVPVVLAGALALAGLGLRRGALLCAGVALLASGLGARAWAGLGPPTVRAVRAEIVLVSDPESFRDAVRVYARLGSRRVEVWARGEAAAGLRARLAGERVSVAGTLRPVPPERRSMLAARHVGARLAVTGVDGWRAGDPASRLANALRRTIARGAAALPDAQRPLFLGFLLGDDRGQRPETVDDFRAAGLTHLLVVSGSNVAFVLALAGVVLRRLPLGARLAGGVLVLAWFGLLTRWEPSVLRAEAMALLALVAAHRGLPQRGVRILALAVTGLLLVDPLLVRSAGFLLSTGAAAGIVVLAAPLAALVPGPRPLAHAFAATAAAQIGVAPVLVPLFGPMPLAAVPANLLAVPAAAPAVVWGFAAGVPAGVLGAPLAAVLHLPTRLLVGWVAAVARLAAAAPLGAVGLPGVGVLAAALAVALAGGRAARRVAGAAALAVCLAAVAGAQRAPPLGGREVADGARVWRRGGCVVVELTGATDPAGLLAGLRAARVGRVDLAVLASRAAGDAFAALRARHPVGSVLTPAVARPGDVVGVGPLAVRVEHAGPALRVSVRPR